MPRPRKEVEAEIYMHCAGVLDTLPDKLTRLRKARRNALFGVAKAVALVLASVVVVWTTAGTKYGDHYDVKDGYIVHTTMVNDPTQTVIAAALVCLGVGILWAFIAVRRLLTYKIAVFDRLRAEVLRANPELLQEFRTLPAPRRNDGIRAGVLIAAIILYGAFTLYLSNVLA